MFTTSNICLSDKDIKRFWKKVNVCKSDECWPWLAGKTKYGHGVFSIRHKWINAHRVSFFIKNGYLPDIKQGRLVMHDCENPECQNYDHLLDGDNQQNQKYAGCIKKHKSKIPYMLGKTGILSPRWGLKHSDEAKAQMVKSAIKRGGWNKCNEVRKKRKMNA